MSFRTVGIARMTAVAFSAAFIGNAHAAEVVVQNDNLMEGQSVGICPCFLAGEEAAVWLTAPCDGTIVAVQVLWRSLFGGQPQSLEEAITIYEAGTFPVPGPIMTQPGVPPLPAVFEGPVMTDGVLNEFRFLDEFNTVPLAVPVVQGQTFVVSFKFGNTNDSQFQMPSVGWDCNTTPPNPCQGACQAGRNAINAFGPGWIDGCVAGINGDWIIRAVVNCVEVTGRCCLPSGNCVVVTEANCTSLNGGYAGNNTTCVDFECPPPSGACCINGVCSQQTFDDCASLNGTFIGVGAVCNTNSCRGACCVPSTQACVNFTQPQCNSANGVFQGIGTNCATFVCFPIGACCLPTGNCVDGVSPEDCDALDGIFQGHQTVCSGVECPEPVGFCCLGETCIDEVTFTDCTLIAGTWGGPNTLCEPASCSGAKPCPGDIAPQPTPDGSVGVPDLLLIINSWGTCAGCPADVAPQPTPDGTVGVPDLLFIINNWGPCN